MMHTKKQFKVLISQRQHLLVNSLYSTSTNTSTKNIHTKLYQCSKQNQIKTRCDVARLRIRLNVNKQRIQILNIFFHLKFFTCLLIKINFVIQISQECQFECLLKVKDRIS